MAAAGREVQGNYVHRGGGGQQELIDSARQSAKEMAEYYHSKVMHNGVSSQQADESIQRGHAGSQGRGVAYPQGSTISRGVSTPRGDNRSSGRSSGDSGSGHPAMHTGQFRATPVKVDHQMNEGSEMSDNEREYHRELMSSTQNLLTGAGNSSWLKSKEEARQYWKEEAQRVTHRSPQHRRHNTSPAGKYFQPAIGVVSSSSDSHRTLALTTDNLRKFNRGDIARAPLVQTLRRSMSSSTLDMIEKKDFTVAAAPEREFGSTSSIDVQSTGGESFFRMLQGYTAVDDRSPAPPQFKQLIKGSIMAPDGRSNTAPPVARIQTPPAVAPKRSTIERSHIIPSPKPPRRNSSKREKRDRTKSYTSGDRVKEGSFFRKLRKGEMRGDGRGQEGHDNRTADEMLEARIEEGVRRRAFEHYDVQSLHFELADLRRSQDLIAKCNVTTGASAASRVNTPNTPEGSVEDLLSTEDQDVGDNRGNELISSCPFFRNEIGDEAEPRVTLSKMGMLITRAMRRYRHKTILERGKGLSDEQSNYVWRGPVIEHSDLGALYYRTHFYKHEHQNYFGVDDYLGPLAISVRRERVEEQESPIENSKDHNMRYRYRIILRTSELTTLRGSVMEDSIPSTTKHNTNRGIPLRDVLEYIAPNLPLACLRLAPDLAKVKDQLLKIDEQGVRNMYKVGIMYCRAGQSTEEEMYNNEHSSPAFDEFLECIGEKVRLKDFDKYRAQLDNKTDSTGTHSLYASYQGNEVMFHVSTMLPFTKNRQQLLRKRHIGNDIVTIVFQEPGALPFTPKNVRSQFQHVFLIVRVHDPNTENVSYSIAVSRSKEVPAFGPPLPQNPLFKKSRSFADFLLAKMLNAENAVHKADKFIAMATRTRKEYLKDLAATYSTTTAIETGGGGKFKLFDKKKEKTCPRPAPDFKAKGALLWDVQVYMWSPMGTDDSSKSEDFSLSDPVECMLAISMDTMVLSHYHTREVLFSMPCISIIGWTPYPHGLKLYFNEGNCVRLRIPEQELDEVPEIVKRFEAVSNGTRTKEITLRRNGLGQLGFHVHYQGIVVEVDPYGFAWQAGLRKGGRLVEICEIAVCTQSHEEMIDLLRTSQTVKVVVVSPCEDGSPRRGSTMIEYVANGDAIVQPAVPRPVFDRAVSFGKGPHRSQSQMAGLTSRDHGSSHSRSASIPAQHMSSMQHRSAPNTPLYPPTPSDESLPAKGSVRSTISTFERRITTADSQQGSKQQRPHTARLEYWKEINAKAHQQANTSSQGSLTPAGTSSGHSRGLSHDAGATSAAGSGSSKDRSFTRLVHERRSAREVRRRPRNEMQARMRSSQEDLDRIGSGEESLESYRNRVYRDISKPWWQKQNEEAAIAAASSSYPSERGEDDKQQAQFVTPKARYPLHNVAQATIKHTSSGDTQSANASEEKWYDTEDDANGYHGRDAADGSYRPVIAPSVSGSAHQPSEESRISGSNYATAERYSPTEQLLQRRSREGIDLEMQPSSSARLQRPNHLAGIVPHHQKTTSNASDQSAHSVHSTLSGGSGSTPRDYGSLRGGGARKGSIPSLQRGVQSPETVRQRASSPGRHGSGGGTGENVPFHRRGGGPSASSSSSMSESSSSPKLARRRPLDGHKSSNESLATRQRGNSVTTPTAMRSATATTPLKPQSDNRVQDDLRKLIAPEAFSPGQERERRERLNDNESQVSAVMITVPGNHSHPMSNGHHRSSRGEDDLVPSHHLPMGLHPPLIPGIPSSPSSSTPSSALMVHVDSNPIRTGSGGQLLASTAAATPTSTTTTTNRTPHFQICISSVPNNGALPSGLSVQPPLLTSAQSEESLINNRSSYPRVQPKGAHAIPHNKSASDLIYTSTLAGALPSKMQAERTLLQDDDRPRAAGMSASTGDMIGPGFPLPDPNTGLDWDNLVRAAKEFHAPGMEQSALRSLSIDHLDDADDAIVGAVTFANTAAVDKRMSKSSDSLSAGLSQRRSRSTSVGEKDADSAYEEGSARTRSKSELENEVRKLMHQLNFERQQKESMQGQIAQLQDERKRLRDESTTAAVQLRHFKDWILEEKPSN